jgi:hypothetical protein
MTGTRLRRSSSSGASANRLGSGSPLGEGLHDEPGGEHGGEVLLDGPVEPRDLGAEPGSTPLPGLEVVIDRPVRSGPRLLGVERGDHRMGHREQQLAAGRERGVGGSKGGSDVSQVVEVHPCRHEVRAARLGMGLRSGAPGSGP